jgi:hypothetical protein
MQYSRNNNRRVRRPKRASKYRNIQQQLRGIKSPRKFKEWPPKSVFAKLHYSLGGTQTTTTTLGEILIAANNPNDPGQSISAAQPVFWDQLIPFYNKYRVWSASIEVNVQNTTASVPYVVAVYPTRSTTAATTLDDSVAQPRCISRMGGGSGGNDKVRIVDRLDTSFMVGTPVQMSGDFGAGTTSNPSISWYWMIASQANDVTTSITLAYSIKLTQMVELYDVNYANLSVSKAYSRFCLDFRPKSDVIVLEEKQSDDEEAVVRPASFQKHKRLV